MEKEECSIDWKSCSTVTFSIGSALSPFCFGFLTFFFFTGMDMGRKIIRIRIPKPVKEVIESADTGSITKLESAEDCIEWI